MGMALTVLGGEFNERLPKMNFICERVVRIGGGIVRKFPWVAYYGLKQRHDHSFSEMPDRPPQNFEDLCWMFESNQTNKGLVLLELDEAVYLFRLVRGKPSARILEIGRWRGGSTFLFAVASDQNAAITSIDIAPENDRLLQDALEKTNLAHKVQLLVGPSAEADVGTQLYDLLFFDGDHSHEGARRDYDHWKKTVKAGGHLALHNAAWGRPFTNVHSGSRDVAEEISARDQQFFRREPDVGSLALFIRTAKPWP
jgi:predicted O-methyltransferase YrrM